MELHKWTLPIVASAGKALSMPGLDGALVERVKFRLASEVHRLLGPALQGDLHTLTRCVGLLTAGDPKLAALETPSEPTP